jgi:hypothetical protein
MKNTSIGTCHFISLSKAEAYYLPYNGKGNRDEVKRKIQDGEISIGPPKYDAEKYSLSVNNEGRYFLTDK